MYAIDERAFKFKTEVEASTDDSKDFATERSVPEVATTVLYYQSIAHAA